MEVVFVSNYYNHHQKPFCRAMDKLTNNSFCFIATSQVSEWRKQIGYKEMTDDFVLEYETNREKCDALISDADCVIYGAAPYELIRNRLMQGKLTFLYSERLHKEKYNHFKLVKHVPQFYRSYGRFRNLYCLCASAFTAYDFSKTFTFKEKCYKWGYFPETRYYESADKLLDLKNSDEVSLLYVGRLIDWKHPEYPLQLARRLKGEGIHFHLDIIGIGDMQDECRAYIKEHGLEKSVSMLGSMPTESVRRHMEKANIFLFTSDRKEGWGAVLNESMNSGCAVIAGSEIGSVPYLIKDNENGLIFKDGDFEDFYRKAKRLIEDKDRCRKLGANAYETIVNTWNADNAAKSFLSLSRGMMNNHTVNIDEGPCSKSDVIKDGWYSQH